MRLRPVTEMADPAMQQRDSLRQVPTAAALAVGRSIAEVRG
jgi:hypothetical protein